MDFSPSFVSAFKFTMRYEVGPNFNFDDPDTQSGKCSSKVEQGKTGYSCIAEDAGGETKFGIAKNANPDVDIKSLTLREAMTIYYNRYWVPLGCDNYDFPLAVNVFDAGVNHGTGGAAKMLQRAVNVTADGQVGKQTINATKTFNSLEICDKILKSREDLFRSIVSRKPEQAKFLKGWLSRIASIKAYIASQK